MSTQENRSVQTDEIKRMLKKKKGKMKLLLSHCVHCSLCAESCFLYMAHDRDPQYMPSFKALQSLGKLYRKNGKVDRAFLERIKGIVWRNCVLCRRCYCPIGIDIPSMITFARTICRSQGVFPQVTESVSESWL
ncbi:MAG: 4Fe-4S dicluster domain-containing protein [Thermodesulfobacteriota bacterium]